MLIVRLGAMGDVLHGMPAVAGLRKALPDCFIGWAVEPRWKALLRSEAGVTTLVDRVHPVPTREWRKKLFSRETRHGALALARELRGERYDVCVDLQGSIKSAVVTKLARTGRIAGPLEPRESAAKLFYSERVSVTSANVIGQACELVSAAIGGRVEAAGASLPVDEAAERWCDELLAAREVARFVLLAPSGGWGAKEWGTERYGEVAKRLREGGFTVLTNTVPGTGASANPNEVSSTLPQLVALTRRAALVVGGDTGPVHLAAALGRPVVALFGPTDPARTGPYFPGAWVRVLRDASSVTDHRRHRETESGLARIRVVEVLGACLEMLQVQTG